MQQLIFKLSLITVCCLIAARSAEETVASFSNSSYQKSSNFSYSYSKNGSSSSYQQSSDISGNDPCSGISGIFANLLCSTTTSAIHYAATTLQTDTGNGNIEKQTTDIILADNTNQWMTTAENYNQSDTATFYRNQTNDSSNVVTLDVNHQGDILQNPDVNITTIGDKNAEFEQHFTQQANPTVVTAIENEASGREEIENATKIWSKNLTTTPANVQTKFAKSNLSDATSTASTLSSVGAPTTQLLPPAVGLPQQMTTTASPYWQVPIDVTFVDTVVATNSSKKVPLWGYLIIGIGAPLCLFAIIIFLYRLHDKKTGE